jgi:hypothetical protein
MGDRSALSVSESMRVGIMPVNPSGIGWSAPAYLTNVPACCACRATRRSARPNSLHKPTPRVFRVRNESAPASITNPSTRSVWILPPRRSAFSNSVTSAPGARRSRRSAAARPVIPPPTTAMSITPRPPIRGAMPPRASRRSPRAPR